MRYLAYSRITILEALVYRGHFILTVIGSLIYLVLVFFLWKSVFENSSKDSMSLSLEQTIAYISIALLIFNITKTWTDYKLHNDIRSGSLAVTFTRPIDYQIFRLFDALGLFTINLIAFTFPTLIFIKLFSLTGLNLDLNLNFLFIVPALFLSFLLSFGIDYLTGLITFYTESIWGISASKEATIIFLSGGLIPLGMLPESVQSVLSWTPFPSLFYEPTLLLLDHNLSTDDIYTILIKQVIWVVVILVAGRLFFRIGIKQITINGG